MKKSNKISRRKVVKFKADTKTKTSPRKVTPSRSTKKRKSIQPNNVPSNVDVKNTTTKKTKKKQKSAVEAVIDAAATTTTTSKKNQWPTEYKQTPKKVLDAIATVQARTPGATSARRTPVIALANLGGKSTLLNSFTDLKKMKLIKVYANGKEIQLTDEGSQLAETTEYEPCSNEEYHRMIKNDGRLNSRDMKVFDLLLDGKVHSRKELLDVSECSDKTMNSFLNLLIKLKKARIIEPTDCGGFKMTNNMFPFPN